MNDKSTCTGCGTCISVCKQNAIAMMTDPEGFFYPEINRSLCTNCGKCNDICPENKAAVKSVAGIAFRHADENVWSRSASGGAFSAITETFWMDHPEGIVFGAAFDEDFSVRHIGITKEQGIARLHGSKYFQSYCISNIYAEIEKMLDAGQNVLFSGTPCQCSAVRKLFGCHDKLLIVDLICNGVASPEAFRKYLKTLAHGKKVISYCFRNKQYEKGRGMSCTFDDGTRLELPHGKDLFCKLYMTNMMSRPSCYQCKFTTPDRSSDLTLGDFHGLAEIDPLFPEDGTSLVIPHTLNGKQYADSLRKFGQYKEYAIAQCLQSRLINPPKQPLLRKFILKDFLTMDHEIFLKKYGKMI